jgi:hypothetical protein
MIGFTRVRLNLPNIRWLLGSPAGPVTRRVTNYCQRAASLARTRAPVDTGELSASIGFTVTSGGLVVRGRLYASAPQAIYVHQGTGVYAGRGPIRPRNGKYLVWTPHGSSTPIFAKQVRGIPPNPFLTSSMRDTVPWPVTTLAA